MFSQLLEGLNSRSSTKVKVDDVLFRWWLLNIIKSAHQIFWHFFNLDIFFKANQKY